VPPGITPMSDGDGSIAGSVKVRSVDPDFIVDDPGVRGEDVGPPALPMDMVKDNANRVGLNYEGALSLCEVDVGADWHHINHTMDNYSFRPVAGMHMQAPSDSRWQLRGGLENLFDRNFHEHLTGINRVTDGDVAVGDPIPAADRFAYVEARYYW
jgi:hypothetical protein